MRVTKVVLENPAFIQFTNVLRVEVNVVGRLEEFRGEFEAGEMVPRGAEAVEDALPQRLVRRPMPGHGGQELWRVEPLRHEGFRDVDGVLLEAVVAADVRPGTGGAGVQQEVSKESQQLAGLFKVEQAGLAVAGIGQAQYQGAQGLAPALEAVLPERGKPAAVAAQV